MKPLESFIEQPVRSLQTMLRIIAIDQGDKQPLIPDGIYGQSTMQAITDFQKSNSLPVTGVTDQATWDSVYERYENALNRIGPAEPIEIHLDPNEILVTGSSGPNIYLLQSMLIFLSEQHASIHPAQHTGIYDEDTKLAVTDLQTLANIPVTGDTDRLTWKNIVKQFSLNAHHFNRNIKPPEEEIYSSFSI